MERQWTSHRSKLDASTPEPRFLSNDEFAFVARRTPLASFDIITRDADGNVLVGLRTNEPAKGMYFVPGGIVRKNETLANAFARILESEIGLKASLLEAKFIGVYEHIYETNTQGEHGYGTHCIVLAHELNLVERPQIVSDTEHVEFRWMSPLEIASSPDVHPNTQAYFHNGGSMTSDKRPWSPGDGAGLPYGR
jgi:colanic acid biosynthesis protein WcaH